MLSKQENKLFNSISRSHLYWGRKPISGLSRVLEGLTPGDIFLDPFCGGGVQRQLFFPVGDNYFSPLPFVNEDRDGE